MAKLVNLYAATDANMIDTDPNNTFIFENAGAGRALKVVQSAVASAAASVAAFSSLNSAASGVFMEFIGGVVSTASLNLAANKTVGAVRVHVTGSGGDAYGFIPIFTGVV